MKHRIADVRRQKGMSQTELAGRIGATLSMVGKLERGERQMTFSWLSRIAEALQVPTGELLDASDAPVHVGHVDSRGKVVSEDFAPSWLLDDTENDDGIKEVQAWGAGKSTSRSVKTVENIQLQLPADSDLIYDAPLLRPGRATYGRLAMIWIVQHRHDVQFYEHYVGMVMPGSKPKRHHVLPINGPIMEDVVVSNLALVKRINLP